MIYINLLPVRDTQKKEKLRCQLLVAALSLGVVLLSCGGLYASIAMKITARQESIAQTQAEIGKLKKVIGEVHNFKKLQTDLQEKLDVLQTLKASKSGPVYMLDELVKAVPDKLWLESFKESGGKITMSGIGLNEQVVAQFLQKLELSPYYKHVELSVTEQKKNKQLKLQKFKATCQSETPERENNKIAKK